jgi:hypothetical protein
MKVTIELEFESQEVTSADVINYLNELIDNDCLDFEVHNAEVEK